MCCNIKYILDFENMIKKEYKIPINYLENSYMLKWYFGYARLNKILKLKKKQKWKLLILNDGIIG